MELYPRFDAERYFRYNQDQLVTGKIKYHKIYPTLRSLRVIKSTSDSRNFIALPFGACAASTASRSRSLLIFCASHVSLSCFLHFVSTSPPPAWSNSGSNTSFTYFLHLQKSLVATSREQMRTFPHETEENNASRYAPFEWYPHIRSEIRYNAVVFLRFHCFNEMSSLSLETVSTFN